MFQLRWLWRNMEPKYRIAQVTALFIAAITNCLLLVNPFLTSILIDDVIVAQNPDPLLGLLFTMLAFEVSRQGMRYLMIILLEKSAQHMLLNMRQHLFGVLQYQEMRFFDRNRTGDLMTRLSADLDWCRHFVSYLDYMVVDCVVEFAATMIMFFCISWKMTLALLAVTPLLMLITRLYSKKVRPKFVGMRDRLSEMNTTAQENIAGNRVVKAFAREDYERERFGQRNREFREANLDINKMWLSFFPFIEILANAMTLITIFVGGLFIIWGEITPGELTIFINLSWALSNPMRNLGNIINDLQRFGASASKVIEVYYARPLIVDRADAVEHDQVQGKITFRNVHFSFGSVKVLEDISFEVEPGQTLAIMGPTGSGKTTLINLLSRFYDVDSGEILVDDCNVRMWKLQQLRHKIGTATQDVFLFSDTIEGNVAFGNQSLTEEEAKDYARRAAADEFVTKMPEGYDTIVGERGVGLSGGQKQRIALARAMAVEPAILVLDDTTSAVDLETEKYIQQQLRELPYACTKIIIAQRISSVKDADQILVLENGRITERGTHEELLKNRGYYWETYALQNDIHDEPAMPVMQGGVV